MQLEPRLRVNPLLYLLVNAQYRVCVILLLFKRTGSQSADSNTIAGVIGGVLVAVAFIVTSALTVIVIFHLRGNNRKERHVVLTASSFIMLHFYSSCSCHRKMNDVSPDSNQPLQLTEEKYIHA